jgi:hypothetical protein
MVMRFSLALRFSLVGIRAAPTVVARMGALRAGMERLTNDPGKSTTGDILRPAVAQERIIPGRDGLVA